MRLVSRDADAYLFRMIPQTFIVLDVLVDDKESPLVKPDIPWLRILVAGLKLKSS